MRFRKGQKILKVPPMGSLEAAYLEIPGRDPIVLNTILMDDMQRLHKSHSKGQAWPMHISLAAGANEVHLWPIPHKAGKITIRYYPPMVEI